MKEIKNPFHIIQLNTTDTLFNVFEKERVLLRDGYDNIFTPDEIIEKINAGTFSTQSTIYQVVTPETFLNSLDEIINEIIKRKADLLSKLKRKGFLGVE